MFYSSRSGLTSTFTICLASGTWLCFYFCKTVQSAVQTKLTVAYLISPSLEGLHPFLLKSVTRSVSLAFVTRTRTSKGAASTPSPAALALMVSGNRIRIRVQHSLIQDLAHLAVVDLPVLFSVIIHLYDGGR